MQYSESCLWKQFLKSEGEGEEGEEGEHETLKTKKSPPLREGPNNSRKTNRKYSWTNGM